jgi:hypothetical protein
MIAAAIGILLSVPFVPPWDPGIRAYAATIPVFSLFPALGLAFVLTSVSRYIGRRQQSGASLHQEQSSLVTIFGIVLALLSFGGPIIVGALSHPLQYSEITCPAGTETLYFRNSPGSAINLVDDTNQGTLLPNIRISDFRNGLNKYAQIFAELPEIPAITQELAKLRAQTTIISKAKLGKGPIYWRPTYWVIADSTMIPKGRGVVGMCGKQTTNPSIKGYHGLVFFYADSMTLVSSK